MRAGSPSKCTASPAFSSQRTSPALSGKSALTASSVLRMSSGSPESATQRNGPRPSANCGRMYAGTKPGNSNARSKPPSCASRADRVAVVEDLGTGILESDHRRHLLGHAAARAVGEALGVALGLGLPVLDVDADRQVGERVVRARLVGDDVDRRAAQQQLGEHQRRVADDADAQRPALVLRGDDPCDGVVEVGRVLVEVAVLDAAREPRLVDVDDQHGSAVEGHGERLRAAHAAASAGQRQRAGEILATERPRDGREGLLGREDLTGTLTLTGGCGGMGGAQPLAVTLNGGAVLIVDVDESRLARRVEHGYLDEYTTDLDEAVARVVAAKNEGRALSVGVVGNAALVFPELLLRGTPIDIVTDQTSAHDPLAYLPVGVDVDDWRAEAERDPDGLHSPRPREHGQAGRRDGGIPGCRRRGLRLRQLDPRRGAARRLRPGVRVPRVRSRLHPASVRRGPRTVPLGRPVG